jgi:hypothetical protein
MKFKEVKYICNLAEFSKEGYGPKRTVLQKMFDNDDDEWI